MQWIKASERLPEVSGLYIYKTKTGNVGSCYFAVPRTNINEYWESQNILYWLDESSQPSTGKWSDSDVKKFLEDYRVASLEIYLNPVIWFDKLNEKK